MFIQCVYIVSSTKGWKVISHNILSLEFIAVLCIIITPAIPKHVDIKLGEIWMWRCHRKFSCQYVVFMGDICFQLWETQDH